MVLNVSMNLSKNRLFLETAMTIPQRNLGQPSSGAWWANGFHSIEMSLTKIQLFVGFNKRAYFI